MAECQKLDECPAAEEAADKAADKAVEKVFAILGVDIKNPAQVEDFREILRFAKTLHAAANRGLMAFLGALAVAAAAALWAGIQIKLGGH